ncbi:MAG: hypothetical protein M1822_009388 [Bathelium mastoideum]|nr:MAG: hypothetical protein M1822_009388 [Bathelium mastoideum]
MEDATQSQQPDLMWTPEVERSVDMWQQTGQFPFPQLHVYPQPDWSSYPRDDLRLLHHVCQIADDMITSKSSKLTLWIEYMPRFIGLATSHPFLMHAVLGFSATHLAWASQSQETKNLAFHHSGLALNGLHDALGAFSKQNSDAVLASSLLLSWQANDWHGWSSLMTGTKTVLSNMQPWKQESIFADYIASQGLMSHQISGHSSGTAVTPETRQQHLLILQNLHASLQRLQTILTSNEELASWMQQLQSYVQRLQSSSPAQTAEQQFSYLYVLRKWLFWVPIKLLGSQHRDFSVLLVLAYFYTTALALEPLFPDVGAGFCANLGLFPLEEIVRITNTLQANQSFAQNTQFAAVMMELPRGTAVKYRQWMDWRRRQLESEEMRVMRRGPAQGLPSFDFDFNVFDSSKVGSLSPAFAPSPLTPVSAHSMGERSPSNYYLEVPVTYGGLGSDTYSMTSGAGSGYTSPAASPAFPRAGSMPGHDQMEGYYGEYGQLGYTTAPPSGFVPAPSTMWT